MRVSDHRLILALASFAALPTFALLAWPQPVQAQAVEKEEEGEVDELEAELEAAKKAEAEAKSSASSEEKPAERKSADGTPEFRRYYGGGLEFGLFFTPFERWNTQLLEPNNARRFDTDVAFNLDLALEIAPIEGWRATLFGGWQTSGTSDPNISALYVGLEPAFAFRNTRFEIAVGSGFGIGRLDMSLEDGRGAQAGLVLLRPFIEARTYASEYAAFYARLGFNYWHVYNEELDGLMPTNRRPDATTDATNNLNEGGVYLAIGTRFGHYPDPVKRVPDTDGDGLRDDVDDCPNEPEDFDGFQDEDGCPDPDNDKDGILDADDACPDEPGIAELKGCAPKDTDGDGIFDHLDKCPNEPEDKDGFEDEDGCPDPDNDKDGILDVNDECPNEPGVPELKGCPIRDRDGDGIPDHLD